MASNKYLKYSIIFFALIIIASSISIIYVYSQECDDNLFTKKNIRIGYAIEPPYSFLTSEGKVTGQSPELAKLICKQMGFKHLEWKLLDFGMLIESLESGEIDVIASGMFITPERKAVVSFSNPVFRVSPKLLIKETELEKFLEIDSFENITVAVISGSVEYDCISDLKFKNIDCQEFPDALTAKLAVKNGLANGLLLSSPTLRWMISKDSNLVLIDPVFVKPNDLKNYGLGGFVFRISDEKLRNEWNKFQAEIVNRPSYFLKMEQFGFQRSELKLL